MEGWPGGAAKSRPGEYVQQAANVEKELLSEAAVSADQAHHMEPGIQNPSSAKSIQKLLLPKPKIALVNVPVMQFARVPVLLSSADSSAVRSVLLTVDGQGSVMSAVHLLPQSAGAVVPTLGTRTLGSRDDTPNSRQGLDPVSVGVQVDLGGVISGHWLPNEPAHRGKSTSTDIQTDITYFSGGQQPATTCFPGESSVSSCSQTDISVSAQVLLPVSVETQTFPSHSRVTSSIGAQTDAFRQTYFSPYNVTRETQTNTTLRVSEDAGQMDQAAMCTHLFGSESPNVSSQTSSKEKFFRTGDNMEEPLNSNGSCLYDDKSMCFGVQTDLLHHNPVADNQTQTMALFSDFEKMLSDSMVGSPLDGHSTLSDATASCEAELASEEPAAGIDLDFEEFLNAAHIQTQTEESELRGTLGSEAHLESLDIETQTDFLLFDHPTQSDSNGNCRPHSNDLGLEMFDTQTQTDLNFLLDTTGSQVSLGNFLKHSSFSIGTGTQTDVRQALPTSSYGQVKLSSAETQTVTSSFNSLGSLFLTSNETQTAIDDFLTADLAWNIESHFSSVETQTSEDLFSLFQHSEKPNS
ncbi:hypothetical protein AGOR_G00163320 [Albula goreensis]|uniref:ATM interactor n=1 Tax=Albula goreensis TaxID=1534307 RepID=A0A8T3CZ77_9TELE|nr:hypothetical protein AGOR_G00163320 [Albula goreensis]